MPKVKITKTPSTYGVQTPPKDNTVSLGRSDYRGGNTPEIKINQVLKPTSREHANLEAEKGETVVTNLQGEDLPEFYKIAGKPHSRGGTPLNLPAESFIFSKDKRLTIKDDEVLKTFGKTGGAGKKYTPAELSLSYNLNKYREILANPFSDRLQRETAEKMIQNYNIKLGKLALVQESMKGFNNGIPKIALGYLEHIGIPPEQLTEPQNEMQEQARFGLETFQGGGSTPQKKYKVRLNSLPTYQMAGETPVTTGRPTKKQNIPKDGVYWDPSKKDYDPSKVRPNHYILNSNGRWERVVGFKKPDYKGDFTDENLGDFQGDFGYVIDKFKDEKFKKVFIAKYREQLKNTKPNPKTGLTQQDIDAALNLSDEEIINNFIKKEKVNYAIANKKGNLRDIDPASVNAWDRNRNIANEVAKELGYEPFDKVQITAFQAGYKAVNSMKKDPEYKTYVDDLVLGQAGTANDFVEGEGEGTISEIDGWDGNTTSGQLLYPKAGEMLKEEVEDIEESQQNIPDAVKHLEVPQQYNDPALYWTEDLVNLGVAMHNRATTPERRPWTPIPEYREAVPALQDFRGQAHRINSAVASAAAQIGNLMGPQAAASALSALSGRAIDGILQTQEAEYRANQGTLNQFELANSQAFNNYALAKQAIQKGAYDESEAARLQDYYDKRRDKELVAAAFNNAWTNKGKTHTLNQLHPDFAVDPRTGYLFRTPNAAPILPDSGSQSSQFDEFANLKERFPEMTMDEYVRMKKMEPATGVTGDMTGIGGIANAYPGVSYAYPQPGYGLPAGGRGLGRGLPRQRNN
jgi:hypothetical protein